MYVSPSQLAAHGRPCLTDRNRLVTDLRFTYDPQFLGDAMTLPVGINNVFDEDPSVCNACGVIGMSPVSHDLPGRVCYFRFTYEL